MDVGNVGLSRERHAAEEEARMAEESLRRAQEETRQRKEQRAIEQARQAAVQARETEMRFGLEKQRHKELPPSKLWSWRMSAELLNRRAKLQFKHERLGWRFVRERLLVN